MLKNPTLGFDAKRASANQTGLGNYSRLVLDGMARFAPRWDLHLYIPKKSSHLAYQSLLRFPQIQEHLPFGFWKKCTALWRIKGVSQQLAKDKIDIYHGLSNELPLGLEHRSIKKVVSIHDLVFLRYPQFYPLIDRIIYRLKVRYACRVADKIIAISECTKRDIIHYFHTPASKIEVVYQACESRFEQEPSTKQIQQTQEKYHLPKTYLLFVGSIEERKNLLLIVKALEHLPATLHLVAVGKQTNYTHQVSCYTQSHHLDHRVHLLHHVDNTDLHVIYKKALIFVYPSLYEGFGIPIIEAILCGLPVIASSGSCLEEAGGPDSLYVSPLDEKTLAQHILQLLSNPNLRNQMASSSQNYVKRFSQKQMIQQTEQIYADLLGL